MRLTSVFATVVLPSFVASLAAPNPVIKIAAQGMGLLKPIFGAEAKLQAAILGTNVDRDEVDGKIERNIETNKVVIYTYSLSPFSSEALSILEDSGYEYKKIELGAEWFLLGGEASATREALSNLDPSGASSLPKIFIDGTCIGGCFELATLSDSGALESTLAASGARKSQ